MDYTKLKTLLSSSHEGPSPLIKNLFDVLERATGETGAAAIKRLCPHKEERDLFFDLLHRKIQTTSPEERLVFITLIEKIALYDPETLSKSKQANMYSSLCLFDIFKNKETVEQALIIQMRAAFSVFNIDMEHSKNALNLSELIIAQLRDESPLFSFSSQTKAALKKLILNTITDDKALPPSLTATCINVLKESLLDEKEEWENTVLEPLLFNPRQPFSYRASFFSFMQTQPEQFTDFINALSYDTEPGEGILDSIIQAKDIENQFRHMACEKKITCYLNEEEYRSAISAIIPIKMFDANSMNNKLGFQIVDALFEALSQEKMSLEVYLKNIKSLYDSHCDFISEQFVTSPKYISDEFMKELKKSESNCDYFLFFNICDGYNKRKQKEKNEKSKERKKRFNPLSRLRIK